MNDIETARKLAIEYRADWAVMNVEWLIDGTASAITKARQDENPLLPPPNRTAGNCIYPFRGGGYER